MDIAKSSRKKRGSILSKLPPEIWGEIGKRLQSPLDVLRFRSVCRTWRSSLPPPSRFPLRVPPPPGDKKKHPTLQHFISELNYYVYAVNRLDQMVVVLEEVDKGGNFFCSASVPLAGRKETEPLRPRSMELSSLSFLSNAYRLNGVYTRRDGECLIFDNRVAMKIVLISSSDANSVNPNYTRVSDLTVVAHLTDEKKLAVLRVPNSNWETDFCGSSFEDIINYRGQLYAVDGSGSAFVMDYTSLQMTKVAAALPNPPEIFVKKKLHLAVASNSNSGVGDLCLVINCPTMRPKLYKLSSGDRKWIQIEFPDDHAFFLDPNCNFAVARDLLPRNNLTVSLYVSSKALNASVGDIVSVVSMIDQIAGSAPGNGSRAAVGEDLVAMTKCGLQARNFITQDGSSGMKRMQRYTNAMPLNAASSVGSPNNSFKQLTGSETSDLESTATSSAKRPRLEINPAVLEEIKEINEHLIDTGVDFSDEDVDPTLSAVAAEGGDRTIIKCTF